MKVIKPIKLLGGRDLTSREPEIQVVPGGERHTYLWIGNAAHGDGRCYATLSGKGLRLLRDQITACIRKRRPGK